MITGNDKLSAILCLAYYKIPFNHEMLNLSSFQLTAYHSRHSGKCLVIWISFHYDTFPCDKKHQNMQTYASTYMLCRVCVWESWGGEVSICLKLLYEVLLSQKQNCKWCLTLCQEKQGFHLQQWYKFMMLSHCLVL